jgi:hypothetical protein
MYSMIGTLLCAIGGCMLGWSCARGIYGRETEAWRARLNRQRKRANAWRDEAERLYQRRNAV